MTTHRRFIVGVTGGIAAFKSLTVIRQLIHHGHEVRVVPTPAALQMVGAPSFAALSGHPIHTDVFADPAGVEHIELARWATDLVIVPATANTIAKLACGLADNLLTNLALAASAQLWIAPAMHTQMWNHQATQANIATLKERGARIIGPVSGNLSSGDSGVGRLADPEDIVATILAPCPDQDLEGVRLVITAGGTHEAIDPVRFIGNHSSGKQGIALATQALARGAQVELISANIEGALLDPLRANPRLHLQTVTSAAQMETAVNAARTTADVIIMAAAVADFRPVAPAAGKIKKTSPAYVPRIELEQTTDILASLTQWRAGQAQGGGETRPTPIIVGFSAETGDAPAVLAAGQAKAQRKGADLLAINAVGAGRGFGQDTNEVIIVDRHGSEVGRVAGTKDQVAAGLLDQIVARLG